MLSIVMALLVISFVRYYCLDENGKEAKLSGIDGIRISGLLSLLATVSFTLFLSTKFNNSVTALSASIGTCLLPTILWMVGSGSNLEKLVRFCLPSGGIGLGNSFYYELTEFSFLRLGGLSIWTPYVLVAAAGIEIFLFFFLAIHSYSRHEAS